MTDPSCRTSDPAVRTDGTAAADAQRTAKRVKRQRLSEAEGLSYPFPTPPGFGEAIEVAPRIWWAQLPLPLALDHVNVYMLDDGDSWTVIDSGLDTEPARAHWDALRTSLMATKPIKRTMITHYHPDHVGLSGWLAEANGAELVASRSAWLMAHLFQRDPLGSLPDEIVSFFTRAGLSEPQMSAINNGSFAGGFSKCYPLPLRCRVLDDGSTFHGAGREWKVVFGHGHAPDHACLYCEAENILIAGDQLLPRITSVVGVWPLEPMGDPLRQWVASCHRLLEIVDDDTLVLCGHNEPFKGGAKRLTHLTEHHRDALDRLVAFMHEPRCIYDTFPHLFGRDITPDLASFATMEARSHINRLLNEGKVKQVNRSDGTDWYQSV